MDNPYGSTNTTEAVKSKASFPIYAFVFLLVSEIVHELALEAWGVSGSDNIIIFVVGLSVSLIALLLVGLILTIISFPFIQSAFITHFYRITNVVLIVFGTIQLLLSANTMWTVVTGK